MYSRAHAIRRIQIPSITSPSAYFTQYRRFIPHHSPTRLAPVAQRQYSSRRQYYSRPPNDEKKSGLNGNLINILAITLVAGTAAGIWRISFPEHSSTAEKDIIEEDSTPVFKQSDITDSYLIMAPNMPPGRPGTLTAEQEVKLREFWAVTLKVFGAYEGPSSEEANGAETPVAAETVASPDKGDAKEKKKSRLNVFKRKDKGDKGSDSAPASGSSTPLDASSLSIADDDDKHGQTKDFKTAIANTAPEDLRQTFWSMVKHDHPDGLLLRFLRARKWDVEKALVMMISTMHWRAEEMHVDDDIIKGGEQQAVEQSKSSDPKIKKEAEDFLAQLRLGKSFLHGVDKEGRPLCIVRARLHRAGEQSEQSLERFTVYTIETARMFLRPPVDTAVSRTKIFPHFVMFFFHCFPPHILTFLAIDDCL